MDDTWYLARGSPSVYPGASSEAIRPRAGMWVELPHTRARPRGVGGHGGGSRPLDRFSGWTNGDCFGEWEVIYCMGMQCRSGCCRDPGRGVRLSLPWHRCLPARSHRCAGWANVSSAARLRLQASTGAALSGRRRSKQTRWRAASTCWHPAFLSCADEPRSPTILETPSPVPPAASRLPARECGAHLGGGLISPDAGILRWTGTGKADLPARARLSLDRCWSCWRFHAAPVGRRDYTRGWGWRTMVPPGLVCRGSRVPPLSQPQEDGMGASDVLQWELPRAAAVSALPSVQARPACPQAIGWGTREAGARCFLNAQER
jgi:hypothetical protein